MDDPTSLIENHEFITDCARYAEGLLSEQDVKKNTALTMILGSDSAKTSRSSRPSRPKKRAEFVMATPSESARRN